MAGVTKNPDALFYLILIYLQLSFNSHMSLMASGQCSPGASWGRLRPGTPTSQAVSTLSVCGHTSVWLSGPGSLAALAPRTQGSLLRGWTGRGRPREGE